MPRKLAILLAALIAAAAFSCGGDAGSHSATVADDATLGPQGNVEAGGGFPPTYREPQRLTPGRYVSPATEPDAWEEGRGQLSSENSKIRYEGTVSGIELRPLGAPSADLLACPGSKVSGFKEVSQLAFEYLPPGTFASGPQYGGACSDGSVWGFAQMFETETSRFSVRYQPGPPMLMHDASLDRIAGSDVNGAPAVTISPVTESGFGDSWIAWPVGTGTIIVEAWMMPLDETMKIAQGVTCAGC